MKTDTNGKNNRQCVLFLVTEILAHCVIEDHMQPFAIKKEIQFQYMLGYHLLLIEFYNIL